MGSEAEGVDGWVMQCPVSLGAGAPIGRDLVPEVPIYPARVRGRAVPAGLLCRVSGPRPSLRVRHLHRIEMGPWRSTALPWCAPFGG